MDGVSILNSSCPSPGADDSRRRGEVVAIVLDRCAAGAWRVGGCVWKAVTSRVASACLQLGLVDGSPKSSTLICAYAPTYAASRTVKEKFL